MVLIVLMRKTLISLLFEDECGQSAGKSRSVRGGELCCFAHCLGCCVVWYGMGWCGMVGCGMVWSAKCGKHKTKRGLMLVWYTKVVYC